MSPLKKLGRAACPVVNCVNRALVSANNHRRVMRFWMSEDDLYNEGISTKRDRRVAQRPDDVYLSERRPCVSVLVCMQLILIVMARSLLSVTSILAVADGQRERWGNAWVSTRRSLTTSDHAPAAGAPAYASNHILQVYRMSATIFDAFPLHEKL